MADQPTDESNKPALNVPRMASLTEMSPVPPGMGELNYIQTLLAGIIDQTLYTTSSVTFAGMILSGLTASLLVGTSATKALQSISVGTSLSLSGTTLNAIQGIRTADSPSFTGLTIGSLAGILKAAAGVVAAATIGTSLDYTAPTLNTIQGIRTADSPQFTRLGLGAAAHATIPLNVTGSADERLALFFNASLADEGKATIRLGKAASANNCVAWEYKQGATVSRLSMHFYGDNFGDSLTWWKGGNVGIGVLDVAPVDKLKVVGAIAATTNLGLGDTNLSHYLRLICGSDLTADRILTLTTGDAARTITLSGNPTLDDWFDQAVKAASSPTFVGPSISYLDMIEPSTPGNPAANILRLYVEDFHGFPIYNFRDSTGMVRKIVRDSVFVARAAVDITAMQVVYASGATGNTPDVSPAKSDSLTTMPAIGVAVEAASAGGYLRIMQLGLIENINTNAFSIGNILYVSKDTAGSLTATAPLYPNIRQEVATVLVKGTGNGALQIIGRSMFNEGILDHGGLLGLTDDDHTQYVLVAGTRAFTGDQALGAHKFTGLSVPVNSGDSIRATAKITEALLESATDLKHAAVTVSAPISLSTQALSLINNAVSPATVTAIDVGALANSDTVIPTSKAVTTAIGAIGGGMVYPGAGIPISTGAAWGTSVANDTSNVRKFLRELSVAGVFATPAWDTLLAADIPDLSSIYRPIGGGSSTLPAFLVRNSTAQTDMAIETEVTLVFNTEILDQGSNFASNTFTAPITGNYQISFSVTLTDVDTAMSYFNLYLVTSNRIYSNYYAPWFTADVSYLCVNLSVLADMDAGDTAVVKFLQSGGTAQVNAGGAATFSGYLVC